MDRNPRLYTLKRFLLLFSAGRWIKRKIDNLLNPVKISGKAWLPPKYHSTGKNNSAAIGKDSISVRSLFIEFRGSGNNIIIGDNVCFADHCRIVMGANNGQLIIGNNSYIGAGSILVVNEDNHKIEIGAGFLGSSDVVIRTSDEHKLLNAYGKRINPPGNVLINTHVWIGHNTEIMKGVTIGSCCVVGAGARVTHDIPDNCLAVGSPARVIKENINWEY